MDVEDFLSFESEPGSEFERKRRKRKKVRLWLGQPKRFDLVKKGVKSRRRTAYSDDAASNEQTRGCDSEEAMAAAILLQMSSQGHPDAKLEESSSEWTEELGLFPQPKGPSWIVDHDYAIRPHKFGSHKHDSHKRKSGSRSKKPLTMAKRKHEESVVGTGLSRSFSAPEQRFGHRRRKDNADSSPVVMTSSPEASLDAERLKPNSFMQAHNEPENTSHGNPVLSLDEEVEIYEFPESACDGIPSKFDVSGVLGGIEGDVAVVIAEDGEKATSQWEANVTDGHFYADDLASGGAGEQLCCKCQQKIDTQPAGRGQLEPGVSEHNPAGSFNGDELRNAPDLIPVSVEDRTARLPENFHPSVREITSLSEDLVRNLENANMLENFMVLLRTIAAGYVPDFFTEPEDVSVTQESPNPLPVELLSNG